MRNSEEEFNIRKQTCCKKELELNLMTQIESWEQWGYFTITNYQNHPIEALVTAIQHRARHWALSWTKELNLDIQKKNL